MQSKPDEEYERLELIARIEAIDRLQRAAAHDVRGTLNVIVLNLELLSATLSGPLDDSVATRCGDRTQTVLRQVGELQQSLSGLLALRPVSVEPPMAFDLREILADVIALVKPRARADRVELVWAVDGAPLKMTGHPQRMRVALVHILLNALEAEPRKIKVGAVLSDPDAVVLVEDDGRGVDPQSAAHVYEFGFSTKGRRGLGLSLARQTLRDHRGDLTLDGSRERITTVKLRVPCLR